MSNIHISIRLRICSDACIYTEVCRYACIYIYKAEEQIHDLNTHLHVKYIKRMHAYIYTILRQEYVCISLHIDLHEILENSVLVHLVSFFVSLTPFIPPYFINKPSEMGLFIKIPAHTLIL